MDNTVASFFGIRGKQKGPKQGNAVAIFCGIISIFTCCFSCNLAYSRYEEAREQYIRACRLIEETGENYLKKTSDRNEESTLQKKQTSPFI